MNFAFDKLQKESLSLLNKAFKESQHYYLGKNPMAEMLSYHYETGGKRLRPICVYFAACSYGEKKSSAEIKKILRKLTPYALAVELIHNATLIHDDIQDGDRTRRGKKTLWVEYSLAQGINCGDAWFFVPQLLIQNAPYRMEEKMALLKLLQQKTLDVILGQSEEFDLKEKFSTGKKIQKKDYLHMAQGKTSALFSMPLLGGAILAGANINELMELEKAAIHLGHAFQIQDDLLDLWGEKGRDIIGSDIAEGKLSYPLVLLLGKKMSLAERKKIIKIVSAPREKTTVKDIKWVIIQMEKWAIKDEAKKDFLHSLQLAKASPLWSDVVDFLAEMLEEKVRRF